jgi:hypothetical protein
MVSEEYTWEYVKQLLKIEFEETETETHYQCIVHIPSFDKKSIITLCKSDYSHYDMLKPSLEEYPFKKHAINAIINGFKLEDWLNVKIKI